MTAAAGASTAPTDPGPRPQLLPVAAILLIATAVLAVLLPLSLFTDRGYFGCRVAVASANATPTASASGSPSPTASISGATSPVPLATTNEQLQSQFDGCRDGSGPVTPASDEELNSQIGPTLLQGVLPLILLGGLAFFVWRGTPITRWLVVGIWVVSNIIPLTPFGLINITGVFSSDLPAVTLVVYVLGILTLSSAAVVMNLKPVTTYLNARRPVRAAAGAGGLANRSGQGGLFGSLFGPRPARGGRTSGTDTTTGATTTDGSVSLDKPATTRPANPQSRSKGTPSGGTGNTGRSKGKRRG